MQTRICTFIVALSIGLITMGPWAEAAEIKSAPGSKPYAVERKVVPGALPAVVGVKTVLSASPAIYRGNCPGLVRFKGSISLNSTGTVKYVFIRSDGAVDRNIKSLAFRSSGTQKVSSSWRLGGTSKPYYKGWQAIKILSPVSVTSNKANFEVRCNPPMNSAISAHGNTDWHIDTANEFLFGRDMHGAVTAANHAPNGWIKRHMHVGLTNTSKYYYDKIRTSTGDDTNATAGIDKAMLFFYAGHGNPTLWNTLGNNTSQNNMRLGNILQGGVLRYYWQCSCEVFAHGPKDCAGSSWEYGCPQNFSGGSDSVNMRNVFERWGPVLSSDLRMACGMSTAAYCHEGNVNKVWNNYNNLGMSVADSFIDGFSGGGVVPLCITRGGSNIFASPLYDARFTNQPNTSGNTYYHILYASGTGSAMNPDYRLIPRTLPRFKLIASDISPKLRQPIANISAFAGGKANVRIYAPSGAVHLKSVKKVSAAEPVIQKRGYLIRANNLIREMSWQDEGLGEPVFTRLMTASMPIGAKTAAVKRMQKGVIIKYKRQIKVDGKRIDVLGAGGVINVEMSNNGSVLKANRIWRKIDRTQAVVQIKSFKEARNEAFKKLNRPNVYKLDHWKWGYNETSGNVRQDELKIVFQFAFVPKNHADMLNYPPRLVEVSGEKR